MPIEDWSMTTTPAGVPYIETTDPAGNPFGGSVAPEYAEDPEKLRQLIARLEARFAQYPAVAARQPEPPGGGQYQLPEDFGESIKGAFASMPLREAERAVAAAIQFQGMRGYQQSLQSGESSDTALARWAPLMFYSHPAAVSSTMRAMRTPAITPYQQATLDRQQAMLDLARQKAAAPPKPVYRTTPKGIYEVGPEGAKLVVESPEKQSEQDKYREKLNLAEYTHALTAFDQARKIYLNPDRSITPAVREEALKEADRAQKRITALRRQGTAPATPPMTQAKPDAATLRTEAQQAISRGKDPAAVAKRFKELTGEDL